MIVVSVGGFAIAPALSAAHTVPTLASTGATPTTVSHAVPRRVSVGTLGSADPSGPAPTLDPSTSVPDTGVCTGTSGVATCTATISTTDYPDTVAASLDIYDSFGYADVLSITLTTTGVTWASASTDLIAENGGTDVSAYYGTATGALSSSTVAASVDYGTSTATVDVTLIVLAVAGVNQATPH